MTKPEIGLLEQQSILCVQKAKQEIEIDIRNPNPYVTNVIDKVLEPSDDINIKEDNLRLIGTLVTLIIAVSKGANIVRVHDVKEAVQVIKMYSSIELSK